MNLVPEWRWILRKAWSMRLMLVAGVLSALEVMLPLFVHDMPRGVFAGLCLVVIPGAMVARVFAQKRNGGG